MHYLGLADIIPENKYEEYTWIDERCIDGKNYCKSNDISYQFIESIFPSYHDVIGARDYIREVEKILLPYAAELLNEYHRSEWTDEEWEFVLGQWLYVYIISFYNKYLKLQKVKDSVVTYTCEVFSNYDAPIPLLDTYEYFHLLSQSENYQLFQYAQILDILPIENVKEVPTGNYDRDKDIGIQVHTYKNIKFHIFKLLSVLLRIGRDDKVVMQGTYLPPSTILLLMGMRSKQISNYSYDYVGVERNNLSYMIDEVWRDQTVDVPRTEDEFLELLYKLLKKNFPVCFVENFDHSCQCAKRFYRKGMHPVAVLYASTGVLFDEVFKAYLMMTRHNGAKLCGIQHGGNYGVDDVGLCINAEINYPDRFYTWGWTKKGTHKYVPMPVVKMVGKEYPKPDEGEDILYVSYRFPKNIVHLQWEEITEYQMIRDEFHFFDTMDEELKKKIRFRPYVTDYGWGSYARMKQEIKGLRFDDVGDYYDSIGKANLVVFSRWSTTISEALCANRPVFIIHNMLGIDDEVRDDFQAMESVGVLVRDFDMAQKALHGIVDEGINKWWSNPQRQEVMRMISEKYAYHPKDGEKMWINEILQLANSEEYGRKEVERNVK